MSWNAGYGPPSGPQSGPQKCAQCGAMIDPLALSCPYCKFTTPQGVAAHQHEQAQAQHRAQWAAHASYVHTSVATARMKSTGTQALIFGLLGMLLFCTPLGIVGVIQGFRARGMSAAANAPVPGTATAGLILSIISLVTSVVGIVLLNRGVEEDKAAAERRAVAIERRIGNKPSATVLDRDTACGLAEIHVWREGDGRIANHIAQSVQCMGKMRSEGDRAELDLVRVKTSTDQNDSHVCFKRGDKWYVERFSTTSCL
jgi:hypothetical protein